MLISVPRARTRELPGHYPFVISNEYIQRIVMDWDGPARALFDEIQRTLLAQVKAIISRHFEKYVQGNLHLQVTYVFLPL